ncbi:MAG: DUF4430 domain-containing protein [Ruminiclostridium sp.]
MKQFLQKYKYILILALILAIIAGIAVFSSITANEDLSSQQSSALSEVSAFSDNTSLSVTENTAEATALPIPQSTTDKQTEKEETAQPETEIITQAITSASKKPPETTEIITTTESTKASASSAPQSTATTKAVTTSASSASQSSATTKAVTTSAESAPPKKYDYTCTFEIECRTVLLNMDKLSKDKKECIPDDGIFFSGETGFDNGESVYDILKRVCDENGIQLETSYTPAFGTRYIEGIGNLYEFDCGTASGWMYTVNGEYMNYGCSLCAVSDGDKIAIRYTCNLGNDLD